MRAKCAARVLGVAVGLAVLAGCSSSSKSGTPASSGAGGSVAITIRNFSFSPAPLTAKVGEIVTITNNDTTDHTVTDNGGAFDTGHIAPGTSNKITLTKAGTYHYHCNIHTFMHGEIDVSR